MPCRVNSSAAASSTWASGVADALVLVVVVEEADEEAPGLAMRAQQRGFLGLPRLEHRADAGDVGEALGDGGQPEEQREVERGVDPEALPRPGVAADEGGHRR